MYENYKFNVIIVFCFILRDGKVLLIKREKPPNKNEYTVIGGKKERFESAAEACKREVFEETGLVLGDIKLAGIATNYKIGSETEFLTIYFKSENFKGNLESSSEGDIAWCNIEESYSKESISEFYKKIAPMVLGSSGRIFNAQIEMGIDGRIDEFKVFYI